MLVSNFNSVVDFYKRLKAPLVTLSNMDPHIVIGAYDDLRVLRVMKTMEPGPFLGPGLWLNMKFKCDKDVLSGTVPSEVIPIINGPFIEKNGLPVIFVDINRELNSKYYNMLNDLAMYQLEYKNLPFTHEETGFFDSFNNMRADDGACLLKISPRINMFVYKGLIPYVKGDIVTYNIYTGPNDFIVEFVTFKKKSTEPDIHTYVRYLYI